MINAYMVTEGSEDIIRDGDNRLKPMSKQASGFGR